MFRLLPLTLFIVLLFLAYLGFGQGLQKALLLLVGMGFGATMLACRFGFTSTFRLMLLERDRFALQAHVILLMLTTTFFAAIVFANATWFAGQGPSLAVHPVGLGVIVGAFVFGFGMQLAGTCSSGCLFTLGSGWIGAFFVAFSFMAGALLATLHHGFWQSLVILPAFSWFGHLGEPLGLLLQLSVLFLIWRLLAPHFQRTRLNNSILWGALILALLAAMHLIVAGKPWGVSGTFAFWGAKIALAFGIPIDAWPYWSQKALAERSFLDHPMAITNLGLILGAAIVAGIRRDPIRLPRLQESLRGTMGGFLMGYGAIIAKGCNIGAYFSGFSSTSLHGWVWLPCALLGSYLCLSLINPFYAAKPAA